MKFVSHRDDIVGHVKQAFVRAVEDVVGDARENAPVSVSRGLKLNAGTVQGGLRASITWRWNNGASFDSKTWKAQVGSGLRYAAQREFGGEIRPVRAKLLHWIDPVTGKHRFAKRVRQSPGGPRQGHRPWLRPAGDRFPEFMDEHVKF